MQGILNVKDFGALGDGCADDTAAIQSAVDALIRVGATPIACPVPVGEPDPNPPVEKWPAYQAGLYFPAGIYRITDTILLSKQELGHRLSQARRHRRGGLG